MQGAGSSDIQAYLGELGDTVSPLSSEYGHCDLLMFGRTERANREFARLYGAITDEHRYRLQKTLQDAKSEHVVLSGIGLYELSEPAFIGNLVLALGDIFDEMRVVLYVRHQVDQFQTIIMQRIEAGLDNWPAILAIPRNLFEYHRLAQLWYQDIDILVRDYGRCQGDVVGDFCRTVGLPTPKEIPEVAAMPDLGRRARNLMVMVNACADASRNSMRRRLFSELTKTPIKDHPYRLSDELIADLNDRFAEENEKLSEQFLGGQTLYRAGAD